MRKTRLFVALVSVLILSIAFPIFAQERSSPPREERDREMRQDRLHQNINYSLNLSQEQKIKILEVWEKYRPNIRDLQDQMEEARISLWKLSFETPSEEVASEIRTKIEEINSLEQKIQESRNAMFQEVLSILTPEQTSQLAKQYPQRRGKGFTFQRDTGFPGMGFPANIGRIIIVAPK